MTQGLRQLTSKEYQSATSVFEILYGNIPIADFLFKGAEIASEKKGLVKVWAKRAGSGPLFSAWVKVEG